MQSGTLTAAYIAATILFILSLGGIKQSGNRSGAEMSMAYAVWLSPFSRRC